MPTLVGEALAPSEANAGDGDAADALPAAVTEGMISVFNVAGSDTIVTRYEDAETPTGQSAELSDIGRLRSNAKLAVTDSDYESEIEALQVGERMFLRLDDADRDSSGERDKVALEISTSNGEKETVELEETLSHSGVFAGSLKLRALKTPTPGNLVAGVPEIETFFGCALDGIVRRQHSQLIAFRSDDSHHQNADVAVESRRVLLGGPLEVLQAVLLVVVRSLSRCKAEGRCIGVRLKLGQPRRGFANPRARTQLNARAHGARRPRSARCAERWVAVVVTRDASRSRCLVLLLCLLLCLVGTGGIEPPTSAVSRRRSSH